MLGFHWRRSTSSWHRLKDEKNAQGQGDDKTCTCAAQNSQVQQCPDSTPPTKQDADGVGEAEHVEVRYVGFGIGGAGNIRR